MRCSHFLQPSTTCCGSPPGRRSSTAGRGRASPAGCLPPCRKFTVVFYSLTTFLKQKRAKLRNTLRMLNRQIPSASNAVQHSEHQRKSSFVNYESPALTAELQALFIDNFQP